MIRTGWGLAEPPRGQPRAAARRMMQRKPQPDRHPEDWGREPA